MREYHSRKKTPPRRLPIPKHSAACRRLRWRARRRPPRPPRPTRASTLPSHPSPSSTAAGGAQTVSGDRFVPCRARSNLALFDLATPPIRSPYCALLSATLTLFWPATPNRVASSTTTCSSSSSSSVESPMGTPGSGNIFRIKVEAPRNAKWALFYGGDEEDSLLSTEDARPRKIPRSPYKMLDAPDMRDDFYRPEPPGLVVT